jgi:hypothetical protein
MATPVTIEQARLEPSLALRFTLTRLLASLIRITVVWGVIAILVPQFGITWWMVALGKIALRACRKADVNAVITHMNREHAKRTPTISTRSDVELLRKRAAL